MWRSGRRPCLSAGRIATVGFAFALLALPSPGRAYTRETHYFLRFGLALATCFDYEESHLIASGDWMMDGNLSTHAEPDPIRKRNKVGFHAFGHSDERFNELWDRTRAEPDLELRLIKLGQFMHFLEDWESHAGFGLSLGHAKATFSGHDPDSLGNDADKNLRMVQSAIEHLLRTCADLGRTGDPSYPQDPDFYLVWLTRLVIEDGLMADLHDIGDPAWKKGKIKGIRKSHLEIRERSQQRVEEFVERMKVYPDKKIPAWFTAGDPEHGIPEVLQIPYNKDADIIAPPSATDPVEAILARNRADREGEDLRVFIDSYKQFEGGFKVRLRAANVGTESSDAGSIDVYVIDPDQQTELASASVELEALGAGEESKKTVTLRAQVPSGKSVMIGALVEVQDFSVLDNESWLMTEEEAESPADVPLVVDVDPDLPGEETLQILAEPKMWLVDDQAVCVLLTAATSEGDATEKLSEAGIQLLADDGQLLTGAEEFPTHWGASARSGSGLIAAKSFGCFDIEALSCDALRAHRPSAAHALVTLEAEGIESVQADYAIPTEVLDGVQRVCERRGG